MNTFTKFFTYTILTISIVFSQNVTAESLVVGTKSFTFDQAPGNRKVEAEIWFEANSSYAEKSFSFRAPFRSIMIAKNADPAITQKKPFIVISHGNWGTEYSQGWLAIGLVKKGYIVMTVKHPGTKADDQTVAGRLRLWDRSTDITHVLNKILLDQTFNNLINIEKIGFAGHSFGGWTGISLAGGKFDPLVQKKFCEKNSELDFYCKNILLDDTSGINIDDSKNSFKDSRFKAFYVMGSGPSQGFTEESLKGIRLPVFVDTAQFDEVLSPSHNSTYLAKMIPGSIETIRPVGHFVYVPVCKTIIGPVITFALGLPFCKDPSDVDRSVYHEKIIEDAEKFFKNSLNSKNEK